jgi:hypothetical protein
MILSSRKVTVGRMGSSGIEVLTGSQAGEKLVAGGIISYFGLGRLEDPQFTIKEVMVFTYYPGLVR